MKNVKTLLNKADKSLEGLLTDIDECTPEERQELSALVDESGIIEDMLHIISSMSLRLASMSRSRE